MDTNQTSTALYPVEERPAPPINPDDDTSLKVEAPTSTVKWADCQPTSSKVLVEDLMTDDMLDIRLLVDFVIFYQVAQSTSGTESYSEGFTLIASILHKIVSSTVSEQTQKQHLDESTL